MTAKKNEVKLFGWKSLGCGSDYALNKLSVVAGPRYRDSKKASVATYVSSFLFVFFMLFFSYQVFAGWTDFVSLILRIEI